MKNTHKAYYNSPIGLVEVISNDDSILSVNFVEKEEEELEEHPEVLVQCIKELDEYFKGQRKNFTVKLETQGTEFQKSVWNELTRIPFGDTVSYKYIAEAINNPKAVRAVGNANHNNSLGIIIPCHRVVGTNGKLTGYAGGIWRKEWLLQHEKEMQHF